MSDIKITVITCTKNSEKYLSECIESVKAQTHKKIEHLFIDGGSKDKTLKIINSYYNSPVVYSGKDRGMYDAFNRGLSLAAGEIIGFLHADDAFYDNEALFRVAGSFNKNPQIEYYSSVMQIYDRELKHHFASLGARPHKPTFSEQLYSSTYYAHPTYYCRREVINKVGEYDLKYKIGADIDWLIRLEALELPSFFDYRPLIKFRSSGQSAKKYFLALKEEFTIRRKRQGLSFALVVIYSYHFLRRGIRRLLEIFRLGFIVSLSRRLIFRLRKGT